MSARFRVHTDGREAAFRQDPDSHGRSRPGGDLNWHVLYPDGSCEWATDADVHGEGWSEAGVPRPLSAAEARAKVPAEYLRILADWAYDIGRFQSAIGNVITSRHAMWMWAVINPDADDPVAEADALWNGDDDRDDGPVVPLAGGSERVI